MNNVGSVIPVFPTSLPVARLRRGSTKWQGWFPFSGGAGHWTFSGRVALYHGLPSLKLPAHSTILVPSYHQGVEIDTLLAAGYRLRYYRVDARLAVDLADLEHRMDSTISALYLIHYFGFPQALQPIRRFCDAHRLKLIEDCALSLFSRVDGTWLGSVGDLALFAVYKTLPLPHGGFLLTKAGRASTPSHPAPFASTVVQTLDLLHRRLRASRWARLEKWATETSHWVAKTMRWDRNRTVLSGGARWDPRLLRYGASSWIVRLMWFTDPGEVVARRRDNFQRLAGHLRGHVSCPLVELPEGTCPLFFPVLVPNKVRFQENLAALGVQSVNLWDTSHPTCPPDLADEVAPWRRHCLELPIHQELTPAQIDVVAEAVLQVLAQQGAGNGRRP